MKLSDVTDRSRHSVAQAAKNLAHSCGHESNREVFPLHKQSTIAQFLCDYSSTIFWRLIPFLSLEPENCRDHSATFAVPVPEWVFAKLYDLPHREQQARIREALEFMNLTAEGGRLVSQYSGGMVRRLEIAQSTLHRPRVLFLDEPTVGLDPIARDAVWKHPVDLRANYGTTLFFTTHYPGGGGEPLRSHRDPAPGQGRCAWHLQRT